MSSMGNVVSEDLGIFQALFAEQYGLSLAFKAKHSDQKREEKKEAEEEEPQDVSLPAFLQDDAGEIAPSSLDLFEQDEPEEQARKSLEEASLPITFVGVSLPANPRAQSTIVEFQLSSWQQTVSSILPPAKTATAAIKRQIVRDSGSASTAIFFRKSEERNARASVLSRSEIFGDAVWIHKGERGKAEAIVEADAAAVRRYGTISTQAPKQALLEA